MVRNEQNPPGFRYLRGRVAERSEVTLPCKQRNRDAVFRLHAAYSSLLSSYNAYKQVRRNGHMNPMSPGLNPNIKYNIRRNQSIQLARHTSLPREHC